ncbi:hypothetical protein ACM66B_003540 [Microbotryomycetes sp. NB124-2]
MLPRAISALLAALLFAQSAMAFFEFFTGQQQQQQPVAFDYSAAYNQVACSQYVCPDSLACVATPKDCGCPLPHDVKCPVGRDGAFVCARDCNAVNKAGRAV